MGYGCLGCVRGRGGGGIADAESDDLEGLVCSNGCDDPDDGWPDDCCCGDDISTTCTFSACCACFVIGEICKDRGRSGLYGLESNRLTLRNSFEPLPSRRIRTEVLLLSMCLRFSVEMFSVSPSLSSGRP